MKITNYFFLLLLCIVFNNSFAQQTEKKMLSGDSGEETIKWDFFCTAGRNSGQWTKIKVPSCWELEGFGEYNYGYEKVKSSEKGLYRTSFTIPETWKDKRIFIVFDGSMTDTKITVNHKQAGPIHQGAFYRFKREITDLITTKSDNKLEVEVSKMSSNKSVNEAERDADFWVFGGIYRPVYLEAVPKTFIEYSGINAKHDGSFNLELFLDKEIANTKTKVEIFETKSGKKVAEFVSVLKEKSKRLTAASSIPNIKP